jgi:hypothetical protein
MAVCSRTKEINPRRCPFCSGRRLSAEKSLAAVYPQVAAEWHPKKNGKLTPAMVASQSSKRVWWQCRNDARHVWQEPVMYRANGYGKCPACFKRRKRRGHKGRQG